MSEENHQESLHHFSSVIDNIIDTYHKLQDYSDEHCICLLNDCRIQNFERFYTLHCYKEQPIIRMTLK
jgi:hypothetical protein